MKCVNCGVEGAQQRLLSVNGKKVCEYLCPDCFSRITNADRRSGLCRSCGTDAESVFKTGFTGCAHCYDEIVTENMLSRFQNKNFAPVSDEEREKFKQILVSEEYNKIIIDSAVISCRVRLARNLEDYPFNSSGENAINAEIPNKVFRVLSPLMRAGLFKMNELSESTAEYLSKKYIVSKRLLSSPNTGALILSDDEKVAIMVNEEDHLREQSFTSGFKLGEAYEKLCYIDRKLCERMRTARSIRLGYLTACLTNTGTGLRASVMMFLPGLSRTGLIDDCIADMRRNGLAVRGISGEGSLPEGYIYQISNERTFGFTERQIIERVDAETRQLCLLEYNERQKLYDIMGIALEDECQRAAAVLASCKLLSAEEFTHLSASVKLGASLGIFRTDDYAAIDKTIVELRVDGDDGTSEEERMAARAKEANVFAEKYFGK